MSTHEIQSEALKLPLHERARLAQLLLASLEEEDEIERAWAEEIQRRDEELRSGAVEPVPADEVFAALRAKR